MAIRYVRSGGDTGAWTGTYASVTLALSGITSADTIYVAPDHAHSADAAVTWVCPTTSGLKIICADSTAAAPPTGIATTATEAVGAAGAAFSISGFAYIYGLTVTSGTNNSSSSVVNIAATSAPSGLVFDNCNLASGTANASGRINVGATASASNDDIEVRLINTTITFGATAQQIKLGCGRIRGRGVTLAGSIPTTLFGFTAGTYPDARVECSDLSGKAWTNLAAVGVAAGGRLAVDRCKMPSAFAATTGTFPAVGAAQIEITDCSSGDTHGLYQFHSALGSLLTEPGIYFTSSASVLSWKIVTTSLANFGTPFISPPIPLYNTGTSAITPYVEILRDGSTTAYQTDEVWADVSVKTTAGSTCASTSTGRLALLGTAANITAGAGLGSWTGESGTAWSGKLDGAGSVTPAEVGDLVIHVCVGEPSITVYVDPVIRT